MQLPNKAIYDESDALDPLSVGALRSTRRLLKRRGRDLAGEFLVEGRQGVREALQVPELVRFVIVEHLNQHQDLLANSQVPIFRADASTIAQLSDTVTPQGILAVCKQKHTSLEELGSPDLVAVCAQIRDPGNAGNVIRCADAFAADAVVFTEGSVEIYNSKTVRACVGSLFHLPIVTKVSLAETVSYFKTKNLQVLATHAKGESLADLQRNGGLARPTAWLFGNEGWGLADGDANLADRKVGVPMWGKTESLNLSTATGICLYASAVEHRSRDNN